MPKIDVEGINVHYVTVGRGADIVMLHGFLGNIAVWHLNMVPQLQREFRITTYDLRGHGYTDVTPTGYTSEELAADLLDAWDVQNVLLGGQVGEAHERGDVWRYKVATARITLVVEIEGQDGDPEIIVVTGWRNEK